MTCPNSRSRVLQQFCHWRIALGMSWPQRHQVRLGLFPLVVTGLASQYVGERMYGFFSRPDHLGQINQAFMAAPPAAHLIEAANARFAAGDVKMVEWSENNPQPFGRRARKRWWRKWREYQDATVADSWAAQLEAEDNFRKAQVAVAKIKPADMNELVGMAAVGAFYDKTMLRSGQSAVISHQVAIDSRLTKIIGSRI
jgi:hypothetical protein